MTSFLDTLRTAQRGGSSGQNLFGVDTVEGIAGHSDDFKLEKDKIIQKVVMQFGPMAKRGGEMLIYALVGHKQWQPVAVIPAEVVEKYDIRPGDRVSAPTMGEKEVRLTNSRSGTTKLPVVSDSLGIAGRLGLGNWETLVNGQVPKPRYVDWRDQPHQVVYYPQGCYNLGNNSKLGSIQLLQLLGYLGRGSKNIFAGEAGAGKTTLLLQTVEGVLSSNPGMKLHFVVVVYHERAEDAGDYVREVQNCFARYGNENLEVEFIIADTDDAMDLYRSMKIAQLATARAERLAEHYAQMPVEDRADVVLVFDSGVRLARTADMLKPGGDFGTLSGGRDPFSLLIIQAIVQAGRSQVIVDPNGVYGRVNLTTIVTLLVEPGASGIRQISDWAGDITGLVVLRSKAENTTVMPGGLPAWGDCLFRQPEQAVDPITLAAQRKLMQQLRQKQNGQRNTVESDAMLVGQLYSGVKGGELQPDRESRGSAQAALNGLVPDLALPVELNRARALIESGEVTGNDLGSIEELIERLVIPTSWGATIWNRLAEEGLVWPMDYLLAKELYLSGKLHGENLVPKPADLISQLRLKGLGPARAQEIWSMLVEELGEEQIASLYHTAYFLTQAGSQPRTSAELATLMGITPEWALPVWEWLIDGYYAPPPMEVDELVKAIAPVEVAVQAPPEPVVKLDSAVAMILETEDGRLSYATNRATEWMEQFNRRSERGQETGFTDFIKEKFRELSFELDFGEAKRIAKAVGAKSRSNRR